MAAQKGNAMLLQITDDAGNWLSVAGIRTRRMSFNTKAIDVTDSDSVGGWRELLTGAGLKSCGLAGAGVFRDGSSDLLIRSLFFGSTARVWQLIMPDFGTIKGLFIITGLTYAGMHDGEITFDLAMESAGPLTFTAL